MKIHANKKGEIDEEPLLKTLNNQTKSINEKKITDRKKDLETKHFVISSNEYIRNEQNNKTISKEVKIADSKTNLKVEDFSNESTKSKEKDRYLLWLFGGTALLTLATFKKGKKISFWAKKNKRKAQAIVGLSATLLPVVSFMHGWVGEYDQSIDLKIGAFSALGLLSWGTYLHKKTNKTYKANKTNTIYNGVLAH